MGIRVRHKGSKGQGEFERVDLAEDLRRKGQTLHGYKEPLKPGQAQVLATSSGIKSPQEKTVEDPKEVVYTESATPSVQVKNQNAFVRDLGIENKIRDLEIPNGKVTLYTLGFGQISISLSGYQMSKAGDFIVIWMDEEIHERNNSFVPEKGTNLYFVFPDAGGGDNIFYAVHFDGVTFANGGMTYMVFSIIG